MDGKTTIFDIWENKLCYVNLDVYSVAFKQLLKHCKSIKCFWGWRQIHNSVDDNSDAGAGDSIDKQMIIPV